MSHTKNFSNQIFLIQLSFRLTVSYESLKIFSEHQEATCVSKRGMLTDPKDYNSTIPILFVDTCVSMSKSELVKTTIYENFYRLSYNVTFFLSSHICKKSLLLFHATVCNFIVNNKGEDRGKWVGKNGKCNMVGGLVKKFKFRK